MNKYKVTVKHDKGKTTLKVMAICKDSAKAIIMRAEGCPSSAIVKVK